RSRWTRTAASTIAPRARRSSCPGPVRGPWAVIGSGRQRDGLAAAEGGPGRLPDHVAETVQAQVAGGAAQLAVGTGGQTLQVGGDAPGVMTEGEQPCRRTARGRQHAGGVGGRGQAGGAAAGPGFGRVDDAIQRAVLFGTAGART